MSLVIVCGIVGFIIDIVGVLGLVVLGLTVLFLGFELLILRYMLHLHHEYVKASDKRTSLTIFGTSMLLRLTYNGLAKPFLELIKKYRKQETDIDRKYNLMDGVIEILTESISFISLFMYSFVLCSDSTSVLSTIMMHLPIFIFLMLLSCSQCSKPRSRW